MQSVHKAQTYLVRCEAAKLLAVRQVTQDNRGKAIAGTDGLKRISQKNRIALAKSLKINKKASPVKKVFIKKGATSELQSFNIVTIRDRAKEVLVKLALEPQWESIFIKEDQTSYGSRPGRSYADARIAVARWLKTPKVVFEAKSAVCFDNINHDKFIKKLNCSQRLMDQISIWLKCGIVDFKIDKNNIASTEVGAVPQSSAIWPLLMNIALCGLAKIMPKRGTGFIKYNDDFIIISTSVEKITKLKLQVLLFLEESGLTLVVEKTKVIPSTDGFNFLGFMFKTFVCSIHHSSVKTKSKNKLGSTYRCIPSKKAIMKIKTAVRTVMRKKANKFNQIKLISDLSPVLLQWINYFKVANSKRVFTLLDQWLFKTLFKWAIKRSKGSKIKAKKNFFFATKTTKWNFGYRKKDELISIKRFDSYETPKRIQVDKTRSPFDGDFLYWAKRIAQDNQKSKWATILLKRQKGKCAYCNGFFTVWDNTMEVDHIEELNKGGKLSKSNIRLLHGYCHDARHAKKS